MSSSLSREGGLFIDGSLFDGALFDGALLDGSLFNGALLGGSLFDGFLFDGALFDALLIAFIRVKVSSGELFDNAFNLSDKRLAPSDKGVILFGSRLVPSDKGVILFDSRPVPSDKGVTLGKPSLSDNGVTDRDSHVFPWEGALVLLGLGSLGAGLGTGDLGTVGVGVGEVRSGAWRGGVISCGSRLVRGVVGSGDRAREGEGDRSLSSGMSGMKGCVFELVSWVSIMDLRREQTRVGELGSFRQMRSVVQSLSLLHGVPRPALHMLLPLLLGVQT